MMKKIHPTLGVHSLLAVLLFCIGVSVANSSGTDSSTTVTATADAFVSADTPSENEGASVKLRADGDPSVVSYIRFVVPAVSGITRVTLSLHALSDLPSGVQIRSISGAWDENTVTFANAPSPGSVVGTSGPIAAGSWVDVDVTAAVGGGGEYDFAVTDPATRAVAFDSRETANAPRLVVQTGAGGSTSAPAQTTDTVGTTTTNSTTTGSTTTTSTTTTSTTTTSTSTTTVDTQAAAPTKADPGLDSMHTIFRENEDASGSTNPTKTRFEGFYSGTADHPYDIDFTVDQMGTTTGGGFLVFREQDPNQFYQLDLRHDQTFFTYKQNGTYHHKVATASVGFDSVKNYRLEMAGNTFRVYDRDTSLTTPFLTWTDTQNLYSTGRNVSYYAVPGSDFCWTHVVAHPAGVQPFADAANLMDPTAAGYTQPQDKSGDPVNIGSARYGFTFDNYVEPAPDPSGRWDMIQLGQQGHVHWQFTGDAGAAIIYRGDGGSGSPSYGYEARITSSGVELGTFKSGTFTARVSGPAGNTVDVDVNGSTHTLVVDGKTVGSFTDSTWMGGRAFVGYATGSGVIRGYQVPEK